jgi:tripartite-type tricarboxylate transporter receptor subunit TctC
LKSASRYFAAAFAALAIAPSSFAQTNDFPSKPIRIIVPYAGGGGTDIIARRLGQGLTPLLKQPVIIENKPGANGIIGTDIVAKSEPDGHTYVLVVATHLLNPLLNKSMPYDTFKDLAGVTMVAESPAVFVVSSESPYKNIPDFVKAMKAKPGVNSIGSSENMTKLVGALFVAEEKLDMVSVMYKGGAPLMTDVASGVVTIGVTSIMTAKNLMDNGRLRPLAVTGAQRSPTLPNVPTMTESGVKNVQISLTYSLYAPAKTPKDRLIAMQKAVHEVATSPTMRNALAEQAATPVANSVDDFQKQVLKDAEFWQGLAKQVGLKGD